MTEDRIHQLDELTVSDTLSYLGTRIFSMEECICMQNKQLTKAKEIIKGLLIVLHETAADEYDFEEACPHQYKEAEQFLQED